MSVYDNNKQIAFYFIQQNLFEVCPWKTFYIEHIQTLCVVPT